jgi:hypothetical protein
MRQSLSPLQVTSIRKIGYAPRLFFVTRTYGYVKRLAKKVIYLNVGYTERLVLTAWIIKQARYVTHNVLPATAQASLTATLPRMGVSTPN